MGLVIWVGYGLWLWWLLVAGDGFWFVVGFLVVVDSDLWWVRCGFEFFFLGFVVGGYLRWWWWVRFGVNRDGCGFQSRVDMQ